ncbi:esterase family protein [Catenovulum sediminis]|uniref:Alpha/beta hydrolase-fold protein n=1 Tax=Catenovulum sediminis TaxID=1740262 RepID=A0ABV1RJB7_9ALTE|nr:alpha/beta hydrolase-fold protein [Catenovulum sediminis]
MNREYHKWWSNHLEREMEILVFGHAGQRVLVFPTRGGRFYEYENLRMPQQLKKKIEEGKLQLYCVDGIDGESFYCFWAHPSGRIARYIAYENYILQEVLPFMDKKNPSQDTVSHGCSLGAFHAANIAFRHPDKFNKLVAFSGRFDLTLNVEYFRDLFDGYYSEDVYFNTPTHFLPNLECEKTLNQLREMEITLVIGEEDPFYENNRVMSSILDSKQIDHCLYIWAERAHRGYYWRRMAPLYL